ncbi:hypothetical protein PR048_033279 [Dryococelus australis]|uniref:Uncharacterized protein n=1 Tax=Dryococelus australis TaxID=614101 RepID=A0ABQ9G0T1_9NEOP|nr:hypothetical protein PR048_033279 [Dryococelus australis]
MKEKHVVGTGDAKRRDCRKAVKTRQALKGGRRLLSTLATSRFLFIPPFVCVLLKLFSPRRGVGSHSRALFNCFLARRIIDYQHRLSPPLVFAVLLSSRDGIHHVPELVSTCAAASYWCTSLSQLLASLLRSPEMLFFLFPDASVKALIGWRTTWRVGTLCCESSFTDYWRRPNQPPRFPKHTRALHGCTHPYVTLELPVASQQGPDLIQNRYTSTNCADQQLATCPLPLKRFGTQAAELFRLAPSTFYSWAACFVSPKKEEVRDIARLRIVCGRWDRYDSDLPSCRGEISVWRDEMLKYRIRQCVYHQEDGNWIIGTRSVTRTLHTRALVRRGDGALYCVWQCHPYGRIYNDPSHPSIRHVTSSQSERATVAERLACSPPTKATRVQSPARSFPDFCMWESCRTMLLVGGFSWGYPISSTLSFLRCSILTCITLIGSEDLDVTGMRPIITEFDPKNRSVRTELTDMVLTKWDCGVVVRLLASHLGALGSIPNGVAPRFLACENRAELYH